MFKGLGNLGNLASLFQNMQQLGGKLESVRDRLQAQRVSGKAGGGLVVVEANGMGDVLQVTIDPSLVERGERDVIEDLVRAAVNQAITKTRELHMTEVSDSMGSGLDLPFVQDAINSLMGKPSEPQPPSHPDHTNDPHRNDDTGSNGRTTQ